MSRKHDLPLSFAAESTLGKLARYLRLAGFDTLRDAGVPDAQKLIHLAGRRRIILTRSGKVFRALDPDRAIFIQYDQPLAQARQVVKVMRIEMQDLRPMTRCAVCNHSLEPLPQDQAQGRVPDYVWRQQPHFHECLQCRRVYWHGSHALRWMERMKSWF